jgi:hypothetical protein
MKVSKQPMPAYVEAALPELLADLVDYLGLEENETFTAKDLRLVGYFAAGTSTAFVVYEFNSDGEFGAIQFTPGNRSFEGASVFSWGRDESQSFEDSLDEFLEMNPL